MKNANFKDLTPKISPEISKIFDEDERVKFAYLFGSVARKEQNIHSDIDIAVYLEDDCDFIEAKLELIGTLMEHFGTDNLDLVILNTAALPLATRVIRDGAVLAERDRFARHRYESRILREYFDFSILEMSILNRRYGLG